MKWRETPTSESVRMNVHIDKDLHKELKLKAVREEKSLAYLVNELLHEIVQLHKERDSN